MLNKKEMDAYRELLLMWQSRLRGDVEHLKEAALDNNNMGGDSKSPTHNAELGTDAFEQDFSLRRVENEEETLEEITDALQRVEEGTYGLCEMCRSEGKSNSKAGIPKTRLKAIPYARNCVACERKREELSL